MSDHEGGQELRFERHDDGVAVLTLSRPRQLNALTEALLMDALPETLSLVESEDSIRVLVVTGEGGAFCAGADLDCPGFRQATVGESERYVRRAHRVPVAIRRMPKPSIAAINGPAVGAGLGLALACDIRYASATARFGAPFVHLGLVPDYGVSYFLPRVIGRDRALEMLLTGRLVDGEEALEIGLVTRLADDPLQFAMNTAQEIAAKPPLAVTNTRQNVYLGLEVDLEEDILELEVAAQAAALHSKEFAEHFPQWLARFRVRE